MAHFSVAAAVRPMDREAREHYLAGVKVGVEMASAAILGRLGGLLQKSVQGNSGEDVLEAFRIARSQAELIFKRFRTLLNNV